MSRAFLVLYSDAMKARAIDWISRAPKETRVTFQGPKRSLDQNSRFWAMLTDIADQKEHFGRKYPTATWKAIMMNAVGREVKFLPTLDGHGVFPLSYSSSDLSISEMAELMTFMESWGAENGVVFHDSERAA
jgi:hypothetical protein